MTRKVKKIAALGLILTFIVLLCGFTPDGITKGYNTERIIGTIKLLSSKEFNGRMAGTPEGKDTEEYIEARFKEMGLKPAGEKGTYFQPFTGVSGNPAGEYVLEVLDGDKIIKTYEYGADYKNLTNMEHKGEVTAKGVEVPEGSTSTLKADGQIALLKTLDANDIKEYYDAGYRGIILLSRTGITRKKGQSGVKDTSPVSSMPRVSVSQVTYNELAGYCGKGYKIHMKSAYEVKNFTARNVLGILKSRKPSDSYLIVSAHMDHLGPDPDGVFFPGALDNASGTACMLEVARVLVSQKKKPDVNVVFIAFSGEEEMLFGSRHYVQNPIFPLEDTRVINLDMVGAKSGIPLTIMRDGSGHRGNYETDLVDEFEDKAKYYGAQYEILTGSGSDHSPFGHAGVPAVTLIDYEKNIYHVPEDTIDNIGIDNLKRAMDIIMAAIGDEIYKESPETSAQYVWLYISGGAVILAAGATIYMMKRRQHN